MLGERRAVRENGQDQSDHLIHASFEAVRRSYGTLARTAWMVDAHSFLVRSSLDRADGEPSGEARYEWPRLAA